MGMPEDHLSVTRRHAQLLQERRTCVAKVVTLDHAELVVVADPAKGADQVPGLDRSAAASGEHQAGVLPGPAERFAVGGLLLLPGEQRRAGLARDGKITVTRPGLDRACPQLAAHSPDLLADAEPASVQVHVLPAEAKDFPAAYSVDQQQCER